MTTLEELAPRLEIYSIDEVFLNLTGLAGCCSFTEFGKQIRHTVDNWIGISVCVSQRQLHFDLFNWINLSLRLVLFLFYILSFTR